MHCFFNLKIKINFKKIKLIFILVYLYLMNTTNTIENQYEIIRIPNIEMYEQQIINGELILTPKKLYTREDEIEMFDFKGSHIENCIIKNEEGEHINISRKKYRNILINIWKNVPFQKIIQNTTFNFKLTRENGNKGYNYCSEIGASFQDKEARLTFIEIINMIKINKMFIDISIKLHNGKMLYFKVE